MSADEEIEVQRTQFGMVPDWVDEVVTDGAAMRLYVRLARKYANARTRECYPSQARLMEELDMSESSLRRATRHLQESGALLIRRERKASGHMGRNVYWLPMDNTYDPKYREWVFADQHHRSLTTGGDQRSDTTGRPPVTDDRSVTRPTHEPEKDSAPGGASADQLPLVPAVSGAKAQGRKTDERGKQPAAGANGLTVNQVATRLAQAHYERLGKMGRVPAFVQIIRKAVERDFTPEQITAALEYLAENRWTLTEEKLANALRGGPQRPTRPAPGAAQHSRDHLPTTKRGVNQWGKPTHYPSGKAILYSSTGAEIQQ